MGKVYKLWRGLTVLTPYRFLRTLQLESERLVTHISPIKRIRGGCYGPIRIEQM
jgi:hypothetical protein